MSQRKHLLQARQVSIFPVLLLVEADDQTSHTVRVRLERTIERLSLELRMTLILSRQFGRVAVGR